MLIAVTQVSSSIAKNLISLFSCNFSGSTTVLITSCKLLQNWPFWNFRTVMVRSCRNIWPTFHLSCSILSWQCRYMNDFCLLLKMMQIHKNCKDVSSIWKSLWRKNKDMWSICTLILSWELWAGGYTTKWLIFLRKILAKEWKYWKLCWILLFLSSLWSS